MQAGLLAFAAVAALTAHSVAGDAGLADKAGTTFSLLPPASCERASDLLQCLVARPKEWSPDERHLVGDALRRLVAHDLVRGIIVAARDNGYAGLQRYATDTKVDSTQGRVPKFSPGFVYFPSKTIGITDAFFLTAHVIDPLGGYRFGDLTLLHELIHGYDHRKESIDTQFTGLVGWDFRNGRWTYTKPVRMSEYFGVVADTMTLYGRGRYEAAWARDRAFATAMQFPMPTIQSLAAPAESFADILAHLILDPTSSSYLNRDLVLWFERNVFPALRDKAQHFDPHTLDTF